MAIIAPSFIPKTNPTAEMWGGISDIFGDLTRMKQDAYQRQRQETLDAQRLAAFESEQRNRDQINAQRAAKMAEYDAGLARAQAEREKIAANRLSPRDFAREATIANARQPIPTLPSNFDQYPSEQGRQPSPTMFGYKGPTEYDRNVARANMMRGVTSDEALTWKRLEDAASTIAKREQDTTKAFHQGQIDEVTFNKLSVQLSREKQALDQARKEAQFEINKKRDDARWGKTRADQSDFNLQRDQKLDWAQSVLSDTDKPAYRLEGAPQLGYPHRVARASQIPEDFGLYGGTTKERELQKARDIFSVYDRKKDPTVADSVVGKYKPDPKTAPGSTLAKDRATLASIVSDAIKAKIDLGRGGEFAGKGDFDKKSLNELERTDILSNLMTYADQLRVSGKERGSTLDIARRIIEKIGLPIESIGQVKGGTVLGFNYEDYKPLGVEQISNMYNTKEQKFTIEQAEQRINELRAQGKNNNQIKEIMKNEGYN